MFGLCCVIIIFGLCCVIVIFDLFMFRKLNYESLETCEVMLAVSVIFYVAHFAHRLMVGVTGPPKQDHGPAVLPAALLCQACTQREKLEERN